MNVIIRFRNELTHKIYSFKQKKEEPEDFSNLSELLHNLIVTISVDCPEMGFSAEFKKDHTVFYFI